MAIFIPPAGNSSGGSGGITGNFVTVGTNQDIFGRKTFYAQVEVSVSGDAAFMMDTYAPSSYSELAWTYNELPKIGMYTSFNSTNAPSWTNNTNGQYWSVFGYDLNKDLFTIDVSGNVVLSSGNMSILTLNPALSGNNLTFNAQGVIVPSSVGSHTYNNFSTTTQLSGNQNFVVYSGNSGAIFILPPANINFPKSVSITIKHSGTGNLNVAPYNSQFIDTNPAGQSILMIPNQALTFTSDTINKYYIS